MMAAQQLTPTAQDRLVLEHRAMAARLAGRYSTGIESDPDLVQVAMCGLVSAARRYDSDVGPFRPFAVATILGELKKHLRVAGWAVHVPRRVQEASIIVERAAEHLEQAVGRSPTTAQLALATGLSTDEVLLGLEARHARFSSPTPAVDPGVGDHSEATAALVDLVNARSNLTVDQQRLLALRFDRELTQRQIAAVLDISQPQVHRRLGAALDQLSEALATHARNPETPGSLFALRAHSRGDRTPSPLEHIVDGRNE